MPFKATAQRIALIAVTAAVLAATALELRLWTVTKTFRGPFQTEQQAGVIVLPDFNPLPFLFTVASDDNTRPRASRAQIEINGRRIGSPHSAHVDLRTGVSHGYSHWGGNLYFSLMTVANDETTVVRVTAAPSLRRTILIGLVGLILLVLIRIVGIAALVTMTGLLAYPIVGGFLYVGCILAPVYVVSIFLGLWNNYSIPQAYLFRLIPISVEVQRFEIIFPFVLMTSAVLMLIARWLAYAFKFSDESSRLLEDGLLRLWERIGWPAVWGMVMVLFVAGAWSGNVAGVDNVYVNIAGLMPNSDAAAHFTGARDYLARGEIDAWNLRRPLSTIFRTFTVALGAGSYVWTVMVQMFFVCAALFWSTLCVMRWRGVAAGLFFFAACYIMARPFLGTTMSESIGIFFGLCAIPFMVKGLEEESKTHALFGITLLGVALFVRMGPMLVLPALAAWLLLAVQGSLQQRFRIFGAAVLAIGLVVAANYAIMLLRGPSPLPSLGGNYAHTLCGMSIGDIWQACVKKYAAETEGLDEGAVARVFYRIAFDNIMRDPNVFFRSTWSAVTRFLNDVPHFPFMGYNWPRGFGAAQQVIFMLAALGWFFALKNPRARKNVMFWGLFVAGVLASVPLVYFEDARRVPIAVYPLAMLLIAEGLRTPRHAVQPVTTRAPVLASAAMLGFVLCLVLVAPTVLRMTNADFRALEAHGAKGETERVLIAGQWGQIGVLVAGDDHPMTGRVPVVRISDFRRFLAAAALSNVPMPEVPFALVSSVLHGGRIFVVEPEVAADPKIKAWWLTTTTYVRVQNWWFGKNPAPVSSLVDSGDGKR